MRTVSDLHFTPGSGFRGACFLSLSGSGAPAGCTGREAVCLMSGVVACPAFHLLMYRPAKLDAISDLI